MVGPGEVDAELEPETAEECAKYGKVIKCVIYEVCHSACSVPFVTNNTNVHSHHTHHIHHARTTLSLYVTIIVISI